MNPKPDRPPVRVNSPAAVLAVVPHLLGFVPEASLVVIGAGPPNDRVQVAIRYDLPDPPDTRFAAEIAAHAVGVLTRQHMPTGIVAGYGPGSLVTPLVDAIRAAAHGVGLELREILRVQDGRYWSYLCGDPSCCPADGVPFDAAAHPAAARLATTGQPVLADREALAAAVAPLTGAPAAAMAEETRRAGRIAARLVARAGRARSPSTGWPRCAPRSRSTATAARSPGSTGTPGWRWCWPACGSGMTRGRGWTRTTVTRTGTCGPTWCAGRSPAMWPRPHLCWRSPRGSAAMGRWPTSRWTAP